METATIRIGRSTHELLRAMAAEADTTMAAIVDEAILEFRRRKFWKDYQASYEALRADPDAWDDHQREVEAWDATLGDGLEELPDEHRPGRGRPRRDGSR